MSLSAPDNNGSYSRPITSGKTPPPAPSAAFAKRARELQAEERSGGRYRPPALRALASGGPAPSEDTPSAMAPVDDAISPSSNHASGFRRARAGTLPSNVQLAAQRYAAASTTLGSTPPSTDSLVDEAQRQPHPAIITTPAMRPGLRHATSVAAPVAPSSATERNSRLRSGSLTLPTGGLSNAFGPSIFSSSWLASANGGSGGFPVLDELRSVTSGDSGADDFDVHTLDYLGLDDGQRPPPAATLSELRTQAQAAIAGHLANPSRVRANTVSTYRSRPTGNGSLITTPAAEEEEEYFETYGDHGYSSQHLAPYDATSDNLYGNQYVAKAFKTDDHLASRPRAISVGTLDDPTRSVQRRSLLPDAQSYVNELTVNNNLAVITNNIGNPYGILKTDRLETGRGSASSPMMRLSGDNATAGRGSSTYLMAPSPQNRATSPKSDAVSSQLQTPTRSLWIGNLDSAVTSEQLIHVFSSYGAIESLRLLPEKECGFVNFVDQADAIRAKDDVLNRLGGNIGMPNGQTIRIGFGKADSAPVAPAKRAPTSPGQQVSPGLVAGKSSASSPGLPSAMDAQLQSTPTRALWIGSIPSTTTPATLLSVFSPYGPIESARVLTHKNCGFINFERLDDAVRARKALNGRDVLGSDVGAIRIGYAKVPVKNGQDGNGCQDETANVVVQGIGDLSVGATIRALRAVKGASTIPADQQVLGGAVENYRSNLLLSMIGSGIHTSTYTNDGGNTSAGLGPMVTEQQMIMRELSAGSSDAEADIQALSEFRPPTMYYTTIPLVSERQNNRRWDASKLRDLRKKLDSGTMTVEEIDRVVGDFLDGELVDLASDWLGNTVVQKLFERCSSSPRFAMLERLAPHLALIGIHKNGTWAAQKIIECVSTTDEVALIAQNLRAYTPPLLLDQFGNYVVQCCLRFGASANEFIFDAIVDRMWEIAQGRFGARSMRACLENPHITVSQQRRVATAIILNSIPLATNPNGALLLTWLLDTSGFPSRYNLLAPRFTPHLSHLCTHKLASLTVLRIVNQKVEPDASRQIVKALFSSPGDHVLADVLGDQVNGVAVVHKILTSAFLDPDAKTAYVEATKRVVIELKVIATQAYRRLIEEVGLPVPTFQPTYTGALTPNSKASSKGNQFGMPGLPSGYPSNDQGLASMMAALQMGGQNPHAGPLQLQMDPTYSVVPSPGRRMQTSMSTAFSPNSDPFNPFSMHAVDANNTRQTGLRRNPGLMNNGTASVNTSYGSQSPNMGPQGIMNVNQGQPTYGNMGVQAVNMGPQPVNMGPQAVNMGPQGVPPHVYQAYMYSPYQQNSPANMGSFHA